MSPLTPAAATAHIDATLAALPDAQRAALQALRETIAATVPDAEETISYAMPAFRYRGRALVSYAAFAKHCSFFPMSASLIESLGAAATEFATAKGTLHFTAERPLPKQLVERIVRARVAEIDARLARPGGRR
jgi:uncharacterized protein YdhG (YjbR/CyaY superfamily)